MRTLKLKHHVILRAALLLIFCQAAFAGPFGFEKGMTKEQVIAKLGRSHVTSVDGDSVTFNTAPAPHPEFSGYTVVFSPTLGAVKILALSPDIKTNDAGDQLREKFAFLLKAIKSRYGDSTQDADILQSSSIWKEPGEWMMGLYKQDRIVQSVWIPTEHNGPPLPDNLASISLKAVATERDAGVILLSYEFEGFATYLAEKNKKQDSVF